MNKVCHKSPSNIAIVKYWGKHGNQLPNNPSISFTLSKCHTETSIKFCESDCYKSNFFFEGKENAAFKLKIDKFFQSVTNDFPFLNNIELEIESRNSFPHSSGIASSASSMSALVLCLLDIERTIKADSHPIDLQRASYYARLASGSASRSVFPKMALWGLMPTVQGSSNEYAVSIEDIIHPVFKTYHDTILIVSSKEKSVSSRAGHALMDTHPQAQARYAQARENTQRLLTTLKLGDIEDFIKITEDEALTLHHLMETSTPPFVLMEENTKKIISKIRRFRQDTKIPLCFTLDAGPNVHCLFPQNCQKEVDDFIINELKQYCHNGTFISDSVE